MEKGVGDMILYAMPVHCHLSFLRKLVISKSLELTDSIMSMAYHPISCAGIKVALLML